MIKPSSIGEHGAEPVHGLPERLPPGETILWQGAPVWRGFARQGLHVGVTGAYFVALLAWGMGVGLSAGASWTAVLLSAARVAGLGIAVCGLMALFAWLLARTTVYTITNRRVVLRFGVALPMTVNLPFDSIGVAAVRTRGDGPGDIVLTLAGTKRVGYIVMWPHVRPWRFTRAEPMLRAIPDPGAAAQILGRALAASAGVAAPALEVGPKAATVRPSAGPRAAAAA